jgi:Nucleotidyl transferase AbiEii toxin, Type IV TA system
VRFEDVTNLLAAFEREGVDYVLIGSMAMAARGIVRATQDIDFFVRPDPDNVGRLRTALRAVYDDDSIEEIVSEDLAGQYPVIRYGPPEGDFVIDIVGRLGDAYAFADIDSEAVEIDGISVRVATTKMLYEMKRDTVRPQDRADAEALRQRIEVEE